MIIDDSETDRLIIRKLLEQGSVDTYAYLECSKGQEGIAKAREFKPHCILLDQILPDMSGLEVLKHLLKPNGDAVCAVVIMTGGSDETLVTSALKGGAHDYISKARLNPELLAQVVRAAIERFGLIEGQRRLETRYRAIVNNSSDAVLSISPAGIVETWNEGAHRLFGWSAADAIGKLMQDLIVPTDEVQDFKDLVHQLPRGYPMHLDLKYVGQNDAIIQSSTVFTPLLEQYVLTAVSVIIRDIGESKHAEQKSRSLMCDLAQTQKMEALGRVAAGVAHDFNNLLQSITSCLEMIQSSPVADSTTADLLSIALRSSARGGALTNQLLSYTRQLILIPKFIDLQSMLSELIPMFSKTMGAHIEVRLGKIEQGIVVYSDQSILEVALSNLASNSSHSMSAPGVLTFELSRRTGGKEQQLVPGSYAVISVQDTGCGIHESMLPKIFEPFFTSKGTEGTGLGLPMVKGFAEQSHGAVLLSSCVGVGTTVELWLPVTPNDKPIILDEQRQEGVESAISAQVLLVDDDADVLLLTSAALRHAGMTVTAVASGSAALTYFLSEAATDLLITDFAMLEMNGLELINLVRAKRPDLQIILITGYAPSNAMEGSGVCIMRKPFRQVDLVNKIRQMIGTSEYEAISSELTSLNSSPINN